VVRARGGGSPPRIIVGRDSRESGEWIGRAFARGVCAEGGRVTSAGVMPTPGVAYLVRELDFDLGVVLSASHNPYADNGIKIFSAKGEKFGEDNERRVEAIMADEAWSVGDSPDVRIESGDFVDPYLKYLARLFPAAGNLAGAKIGLDMANGATTTTAVRLFESLGFEVVANGNAPNGRNINLECGSTHPAKLAAQVVAGGCRMGVAFDGDGDRAI